MNKVILDCQGNVSQTATRLEADVTDDDFGSDEPVADSNARQSNDFGCERCWPPTADAAWKARSDLTHETELIDESHFHVMILACSGCTQRFVSVFTETIDWTDGDDPQYWTLLPITATEAAELVQQGDSLTEPMLEALGPGRPSLRRDYPKGGTRHIYWSTGISVGFHD